jgi:hypothetical protein
MIGEREFFRQRLPHGNAFWYTIYLDPSDGVLSVRRYWSSQRGAEVEIEQQPLAAYLADGKRTKAKRAAGAYVARLASALNQL